MSAGPHWLAGDELTAEDQATLRDMKQADRRPLREAPPANEMPDDDSADRYIEFPADGGVRTGSRTADAEQAAEAAERRAIEAERRHTARAVALDAQIQSLGRRALATVGQPPAAAEAPEPSLEDNPIGHFAARTQRLQRQVEHLTGALSQQRQQQLVSDLRNHVIAQELDFAQREPAYVDAGRFFIRSREAELEAIGITDPAERQRIISNDVTTMAARSAQEGVNFAARMYALAQKRGFSKQGGDNQPARQQNPARLTPEQIADLPDDKFAAVAKNLRKRQALALLMGA